MIINDLFAFLKQSKSDSYQRIYKEIKSMAKQLAFDQEAREATRKGVEKLAKAVKATLGPKGRNVVIDKGWGAPNITKDGVTVAEEIELSDPYENMAAQIVKEVASKTSDAAGDGTTTATVLTEAIYLEGLKHVVAGTNMTNLISGMNKAVEHVVKELKAMAQEVKGDKEILQVATIASNNDSAIGEMIAEAMRKVGQDGVITVEEGKSMDINVEVVDGMQFDRGYVSPHFMTNQDTMETILENPYILIWEDKISAVKKLLPLMEKCSQEKRQLLIIAEDVDGEALATLVVNKIRGILNCCVIKAPGYGDRRKAMMEDIAILTGGKALFKDLAIDLEKVSETDLGTAKKIVISSDNTTITEGAGEASSVEARVNQIRKEIQNTDSDYDREKLEERLAKLAGGIARINVGAASEVELKEVKARIEDAVHATRAAKEEGTLPGGGVAYLRASQSLSKLSLEGEEAFGVKVIEKALQVPIKQISENAGEEGSVIARQVLRNKGNYGYNAADNQFGDLYELGIIDPVKVTRSALQNAVSAASILLSSDCLITNIPEKDGDNDMSFDDGMM